MPELFIATIFAILSSRAIPPRPPALSPAARVLRLLPDEASSLAAGRFSVPPPSSESHEPPASWLDLGFKGDGPRRSLGREIDLDVARLKSRLALVDPDATVPLRHTRLETEEALNVPFNRTLFLVGRVGANSGSLEQQQYRVVGTTGVGVRLPLGGEVQMRRGRSMTNYDPEDLVLVPEQAKDFVEFTTRWPLPGNLNLEYTHELVAPQSPAGRDLVRRDVRLGLPLSNAGRFHIGARQQSGAAAEPASWFDGLRLYLGLELRR